MAGKTYLLGIDLSAKESCSALCVLEAGERKVRFVDLIEFTNPKELVEAVSHYKRSKVGIDAPLTAPEEGQKWRPAEQQLRRMRISAYAPGMRSMRRLHLYARKIAADLKRRQFGVHEVYPHATFTLLYDGDPLDGDIGAKKTLRGTANRYGVLRKYIGGLTFDAILKRPLGIDIYDALDAAAAALTLHFVSTGRAKALGDQLWVPDITSRPAAGF